MTSAALLAASFIGLFSPSLDGDVDALLAQADEKLAHTSKRLQREGVQLLRAAHKQAPQRLETIAGLCRSYFVRYWWSDDAARQGKLARKGLRWARRLARRWPQKAEGHYWVSVMTGLVARVATIAEALEQGMAEKIERSALRAMKRDPTLYGGGPPRLLGRYYFEVPWPLRRVEKSRRLLEHAYRINPADATGQLYLGEVLAEVGESDRARTLFASCASAKAADPRTVQTCRARLASR